MAFKLTSKMDHHRAASETSFGVSLAGPMVTRHYMLAGIVGIYQLKLTLTITTDYEEAFTEINSTSTCKTVLIG